MRLIRFCIVAAASAGVALAGEPTYRQGHDIFIETGVDAVDRTPTWYAPMMAKPYAPAFEILATRGTQGRYYPYTYTVTLKDMIKWHGHDCEGTIHAANAAKVAFEILFPDGIVDRSVLWGISGPSPCWSDAVAFLTGARLQYGNLGFFRDKDYGHAILLYREDTQVAVLATWKKGINNIPGEPVVLPEAIGWTPAVSMQEMVDTEARGQGRRRHAHALPGRPHALPAVAARERHPGAPAARELPGAHRPGFPLGGLDRPGQDGGEAAPALRRLPEELP